MTSCVGRSVCAVKIVKWHVATVRFLFSSAPHELASWVKKIDRPGLRTRLNSYLDRRPVRK